MEQNKLANYCTRLEGEEDIPPGAKLFTCARSTKYGGMVCEESNPCATDGGCSPVKQTCAAGQRLWCSPLAYGTWGLADCDPYSGTWKTKNFNGLVDIDCQELADGRGPDTLCACYHFYYNPICCERPDCVLPEWSEGCICPRSSGALCDYCNPQNPECKEVGARCVVTNSQELYCGKSCEEEDDCPEGHTCTSDHLHNGTTHQCVPDDYSCFF